MKAANTIRWTNDKQTCQKIAKTIRQTNRQLLEIANAIRQTNDKKSYWK